MRAMNEKAVEALRRRYPEGTKVRLIHMDDTQAPPAGTTGEVIMVDDIGTIHIGWETGSSLGVIPGVDSIEII